MISLDERIKILEDKVLKLEGGNRIKEEAMGKEQKVFRPNNNND